MALSPNEIARIAESVAALLAEHRDCKSTVGSLLKKPQAAEYLGDTPRAVQHLISTGQLEVVHLGRAVRIRRTDLDRIIEHGTERPDIAKRFAR